MPERSDLDLRGVRWGAFIIATGILFAIVVSWLLLRAAGPATNAPAQRIDAPSGPAAPKLQSAPQPERAAYFDGKERQLSGYGWVDRQAGIVRIPLTEAMRLMAEQAGRQTAGGAAHGTPGAGERGTGSPAAGASAGRAPTSGGWVTSEPAAGSSAASAPARRESDTDTMRSAMRHAGAAAPAPSPHRGRTP